METARDIALGRVAAIFDSIEDEYDDPAPETYLGDLAIVLNEERLGR